MVSGGKVYQKKTNTRFIPLVKDCGIKQIIDLKTADYSDKFERRVTSQGLEYHHYPIDSGTVSTAAIIDCLPSLFSQINEGAFYISCAQGLHRTDIAMAINYFFNPNADEEPPILYGHRSKKGLRIDDVFERVNSIYKTMTDIDKQRLGLYGLDDKKFAEKKRKLIEANQGF